MIAMRRGAVTVLAALLIATLAWSSGLDRMSLTRPGLARLVPGPLRTHGWRAEAMLALDARRPSTALSAAGLGVRRDPLDPAATSLLGSARFAAGDSRGAADAFRVAAQLGWREPAVQLYWMAAALAAGDRAMAAQRLDALLRQSPQLPQAPGLLARFEADPAGRRALAERLAARPGWLALYLGPSSDVSLDSLRQRAAVAEQPVLAKHLTCADVSSLAQQLFARGLAAESRRLWSRGCGEPGAALADGGFEQARIDAASPYGWSFTGSGDLALELAPRAGFTGHALRIASTAPYRLIVAVQAVELAAGRYALRWRGDDATPPRLRLTLDCQREPARFAEPHSLGDGRYQAEATIVAGTCPLPWLVLAIVPGGQAVTIDDIAIVPLKGGATPAP